MNVFVSTLFPQLYTEFLSTSIIKRAILLSGAILYKKSTKDSEKTNCFMLFYF